MQIAILHQYGGSVKIRRYTPIVLAAVFVLTAAAPPASAGTGGTGRLPHTGRGSAAQSSWVCAGTPKRPGVLTGHHTNVVIEGVCTVSAGHALVYNTLVITRGGALVAAFGRNDRTHRGRSGLTVAGSLVVLAGATLILGCEAPAFPCLDDPSPRHPTLSSTGYVGGNLIAAASLGIILHHSDVAGNVVQSHGGGGRNCVPKGIFTKLKSPVYSDYEDNYIGGNLNVSRPASCWFGALRNVVHGDLSVTGSRMADPDANEVLTNFVHGNLACLANFPAIQYGDSRGTPNRVVGFAAGQCGFYVLKPDPSPHGPLRHIAVPVFQRR